MFDPNTARIFSFSGGGVRGYFASEYLRLMLDEWHIGESELWRYLTLVGGTSIGAFIACAVALGIPVSKVTKLFEEKAKRIFTVRTALEVAEFSHNASLDANIPNTYEKGVMMLANTPFYSSAYEDSNYGTNVLQSSLIEIFGDLTMKDLKLHVVVPAWDLVLKRPVIFSNIQSSVFIGQDFKIVDVLRATSAAPFYFPSWKVGSMDLIDGGIYHNSPITSLLFANKIINPVSCRVCFMSFGTGHVEHNLSSLISTKDAHSDMVSRLISLLQASSSGAQLVDELYLKSISKSDVVHSVNSFFVESILDKDKNPDLDNATPEFMSYLKQKALDSFQEDFKSRMRFKSKFFA